jgi:hypothetical protein
VILIPARWFRSSEHRSRRGASTLLAHGEARTRGATPGNGGSFDADAQSVFNTYIVNMDPRGMRPRRPASQASQTKGVSSSEPGVRMTCRLIDALSDYSTWAYAPNIAIFRKSSKGAGSAAVEEQGRGMGPTASEP